VSSGAVIRTPVDGCWRITDREECCQYQDSRSAYSAAPNCVPSKLGVTHDGNANVCEPEKWVNTIDERAAKGGDCTDYTQAAMGTLICEVDKHPINTATNKYAGVLDKHYPNQGTLADCKQRCAETAGCTVINYHTAYKACWVKGGWQYKGPSTLRGTPGHTSCYIIESKSEVILYQNGIGSGWAARFPAGSYTRSALMARGARNDDASSIAVPAGLRAETFQNDYFTGTRHVYGPGNHNLKANDDLSSMKVFTTSTKPVWSFDTACSTGSSTCTTKHVKKHCYNQRLGTAKYASWAIAKAACAANSNCFGVYDAGCRKSSIYLCDSRKITSSAKLSNSGSSCVFEKPNAGSVVAPS